VLREKSKVKQSPQLHTSVTLNTILKWTSCPLQTPVGSFYLINKNTSTSHDKD